MAPDRDAACASELLKDVDIDSATVRTMSELRASLGDDTCFTVIADGALQPGDFPPVAIWLKNQPTWSDLPFIILDHHPGGCEHGPDRPCLYETLGNVTLLEGHFHPSTFQSVARAAYKARLRQYEVRAHIEHQRVREESIERRVVERTSELNRAHAAILGEIKQKELSEEKLWQSQKREMIGQLTGGVAHDFNNLLMAVIANLELLRKRIPADPAVLKMVDIAMQGAQRGAALTQRLLAFARRQDLKIEPTDLGQLVLEMKSLIARSMDNQIEVIVEIGRNLPIVMVDGDQVELAILNLVANARDAMPHGGKLRLELSHGDVGRDQWSNGGFLHPTCGSGYWDRDGQCYAQ